MTRLAAVLVTVLTFAGCVTTPERTDDFDWTVPGRPGRDLPDRFEPEARPAAPVEGCSGRLVDGAANVHLRLVQSRRLDAATIRGDYDVEPAGSYGVGWGKRLRVDCATLRPLGFVPGR